MASTFLGPTRESLHEEERGNSPSAEVPHQPRQVSREKFSSNLWEEIFHCIIRVSFIALPGSCIQRNVAESISLPTSLDFCPLPTPTKPLHWKTENWLYYLLQSPKVHLHMPKGWFQCRPLMPWITDSVQSHGEGGLCRLYGNSPLRSNPLLQAILLFSTRKQNL